MTRAERHPLVEREDTAPPAPPPCRVLAASRFSVHRRPAKVSEKDRVIMTLIDRQYLPQAIDRSACP
jgi:hypothetical protein